MLVHTSDKGFPFSLSNFALLFFYVAVANMLYLESPAGVGFSYSANTSFYAFVNDEMTGSLHNFFSFFLFPVEQFWNSRKLIWILWL